MFKIPEYNLANPHLQSCWYVSLSVNVRYSDRETWNASAHTLRFDLIPSYDAHFAAWLFSLVNITFNFAHFQFVVSAFKSSFSETALMACFKMTNVKSTSLTWLYNKSLLREKACLDRRNWNKINIVFSLTVLYLYFLWIEHIIFRNKFEAWLYWTKQEEAWRMG